MKQRIITLRLSDATSYNDIHDWLADKLDLPTTYGRNLDALWDCLTGYIGLPLTILWINDTNSTTDYSALIELFEEAANEQLELSFRFLEGDAIEE